MADSEASFDPLIDKAPARYVVGIDLGTTNSAVTYVDTQKSAWQIELLPIPQLVAANQIESRDTLPSFHLQVQQSQAADHALRVPWSKSDREWCVGVMARDEGLSSPGRQISSAKSWLCHSGVDRTAKLLPWQGPPDVERLSPVDVSARYLGHIRDAWDATFKHDPLAEQDIVITLPASFDEVARELTVQAASEAELPNVVLIEEPQAAFYAWVYKHRENWHELVSEGHTILVCDIGGGTSDFTLIKVRKSRGDSADQVQFHRIAVGEHLILGGDNLDMALAQHIETKLTDGGKLSAKQWDALVRNCRRVKETLLGENPPEQATVNLPGSGSKVIGGGLQTQITRDEAEALLVDGFLPQSDVSDTPTASQSGFREFGLPFASDPAITRHLAAFLQAHGSVANSADVAFDAARPDVILFNGGFFASPELRERLLCVVRSWFRSESDPDWHPTLLDNDRLDLAVARGAAYYGMVRRGEGVRIAANLARSYYVAVDGAEETLQAICLVPGHAEPGQDISLHQLPLELTISQPVEFSLFVSSTRLTDEAGDIVAVDLERMKALPPIRTVLRTERRNQAGTIPVILNAHLSEIGTIDLWCQAIATDHRWRLQFDVRSATQTNIQAHESAEESQGFVNEVTWQKCEEVIASVFGEDASEKPSTLIRELAATLDSERTEWPTSLLRRIWEALMGLKEGRRKTAAHESRWLNLLGFALRPGYGLAVDDWRVAETWRHVRGKLVHAGASRAESLILWRRISGGLSTGQQKALAEPVLSSLRSAHASSMSGKKARGNVTYPMHEASEAWRLLGSLELLPVSTKTHIGEMIVELLPKRKYEKVVNPMIWALGRLGQRQPQYGPLNTVVPTENAAVWCETLTHLRVHESSHLAVMQLARCTGDRYRDLGGAVRERLSTWLTDTHASGHLVELVAQGGALADEEQSAAFGESLPKGLRLR